MLAANDAMSFPVNGLGMGLLLGKRKVLGCSKITDVIIIYFFFSEAER